MHTGEKPHPCNFCQVKFTYKSSLNGHVKANHVKEKICGCSICEKYFVRQEEKRIHERTQTGEKPFDCKFCQENFSSKSCLNIHVLRKHI